MSSHIHPIRLKSCRKDVALFIFELVGDFSQFVWHKQHFTIAHTYAKECVRATICKDAFCKLISFTRHRPCVL